MKFSSQTMSQLWKHMASKITSGWYTLITLCTIISLVAQDAAKTQKISANHWQICISTKININILTHSVHVIMNFGLFIQIAVQCVISNCKKLPEFLLAFHQSIYNLGAISQICLADIEHFSSTVHDFCSNYVYVLQSLSPYSPILLSTHKQHT